ncbi:hypothetical protein PENTCL1PPCAC_6774 [Pristionchus entomophagus]|uniref:Domain of unknown function DB domain-containing protein n=1 Tax=Pristionchus entomophagus TaxID=358040 RepID=A0AAV5STA2_9BILA|nr:hypothetical protein PENTCL1PPCAC_6774 [Pristionchus entomophagus]
MNSLLILLAAPTVTFACVASGICGGLGGLPGLPSPGGCGMIPPVMAPSCGLGGLGGMGGGCGAGYSCGAYGCYQVRRARAHSAVTLQSSPSSPSQSRVSLFGADRFMQSSVPDERPPLPSDPNAAFMACCESRGLPDACLHKCTFNTYTKDSLTRMYFKQDACPLQASAEIQFCAAQGRDHRECCARNGVANTISGSKCLTFCDQRPGNVTMLDMSYIGCYDRFENMKSCFWHDMASRLSSGRY